MCGSLGGRTLHTKGTRDTTLARTYQGLGADEARARRSNAAGATADRPAWELTPLLAILQGAVNVLTAHRGR